jgi:DNA (cytosine-5)-methyltransferase 1
MKLSALEICAGGGGQATGLELPGFELAAAVEIDHHACDTLRNNRSHWKVIQTSVVNFCGADFRGIDLLAGGVPCPPFSIAGKQLGTKDERDLLLGKTSPPCQGVENAFRNQGAKSTAFES